jgi:hypothetical protein
VPAWVRRSHGGARLIIVRSLVRIQAELSVAMRIWLLTLGHGVTWKPLWKPREAVKAEKSPRGGMVQFCESPRPRSCSLHACTADRSIGKSTVPRSGCDRPLVRISPGCLRGSAQTAALMEFATSGGGTRPSNSAMARREVDVSADRPDTRTDPVGPALDSLPAWNGTWLVQ